MTGAKARRSEQLARNQPRVAVEFPSKEANIGHRARSNFLHVSSSTGRAPFSKIGGYRFDSCLASQHRPKPPAILTDAANIGDAVLKPGRGYMENRRELSISACSIADRTVDLSRS